MMTEMAQRLQARRMKAEADVSFEFWWKCFVTRNYITICHMFILDEISAELLL